MGHDARQHGVPLFPAPDETARPPPPGRGPPPESTFARGAAAPRPRGGGLMAHREGRVAGAGRGPPPGAIAPGLPSGGRALSSGPEVLGRKHSRVTKTQGS